MGGPAAAVVFSSHGRPHANWPPPCGEGVPAPSASRAVARAPLTSAARIAHVTPPRDDAAAAGSAGNRDGWMRRLSSVEAGPALDGRGSAPAAGHTAPRPRDQNQRGPCMTSNGITEPAGKGASRAQVETPRPRRPFQGRGVAWVAAPAQPCGRRRTGGSPSRVELARPERASMGLIGWSEGRPRATARNPLPNILDLTSPDRDYNVKSSRLLTELKPHAGIL